MKNKSLLVIPGLLLLASCSNQQGNTSGFANSSNANFTSNSDLVSDKQNTNLNQNIQRNSYSSSRGADSRSKAS